MTVTDELFCEELDVCSQGDICVSQDGLYFLAILFTQHLVTMNDNVSVICKIKGWSC